MTVDRVNRCPSWIVDRRMWSSGESGSGKWNPHPRSQLERDYELVGRAFGYADRLVVASRQNDVRRVAFHEFGHFIGLGHPDDHGESVVAITHRHISRVDTLQKDNLDCCAIAIYGAAAPAETLQPASHPRRSW